MQLLFLFALLVVPYLLLSVADRLIPPFKVAPATRGRVGLSLFFLFTGIGHFIKTQEMAQMVPPYLPYGENIIYFTGVLELLGVCGLWIRPLIRFTGVCLILMLLALLPANVYSALAFVPFGGHQWGPIYLLVRIPFQVFLMLWIYFSAVRQKETSDTEFTGLE